MGNFKLRDRAEVEKFEQLLNVYLQRKAQVAIRGISLTAAFDCCQKRADGGRIFVALLDLVIAFHLVHLDLYSMGATWNNNFSKGKLVGGSILDSEQKFTGKMEIHRSSTAFVARYRALWDKLMGFLVLWFLPKEYEMFIGAKSKRRAFKSAASKIRPISKKFMDELDEKLGEFENKFRTPEIHGTGVLRKWSLSMDSLDQNPVIELLGYWNYALAVMGTVGKLFVVKPSGASGA